MDDEVLIRFKGVDAGATAAAQKAAKAIEEIKTATTGANRSHAEHGSQLDTLGKKLLGLGEHHVSARHAVRLFSEATGVSSGGIMQMSHAMGTLGPVAGAAAGGFLLATQAMEAHAEAVNKLKEKYEQLGETVRGYDEQRSKTDTKFEYGESGTRELDEIKAADARMRAGQRVKGAITGQGKLGADTSLLHLDWWGEKMHQAKVAMFGMSDDEQNQVAQIDESNRAQGERIRAAQERAEQQRKYQEMLHPAQEHMRHADVLMAETHGSTSAYKERIDAQKELIAGLGVIEKGAKTDAEREELAIRRHQEELKLIQMRSEASNKYYSDRMKAEKLEAPGVFATSRQKAEFAEGQRYEGEKREVGEMKKLGFDVDTAALAKNHADIMKKIAMDSDNEIMTRKAEIHAQTLRNAGDTFQAEVEMANAHYQKLLSDHTGNNAMQKLDEEQHQAEMNKITHAHQQEVASYMSNLKSESLRIKGDQYGSEREALEEWQRKELEAHKDQADAIKALHAQKLSDIADREKEHHTEVMAGYKNELIRATLGSGAAGVAGALEQHRKAQQDKSLTAEEKGAENEAFAARINRMKMESDAELTGKKTVGFQDLGSAWESFSSSLNKDPMAQRQLEEQKAANMLLSTIAANTGGRGVLVG